ncbi:MAG: uroporphyrinogen decarboxylase [Rhodospirillales bacterium]
MTTHPTDKPLLRVLNHERVSPPPIWLMRQAGRYLPEYRQVRAEAGSFLKLCYSPKQAAEVTLQPLRRFPLDAAIIFSDILVIPHAMGRDLTFAEGEGPRLPPLMELPDYDEASYLAHLQPVYDALGETKAALPEAVALIGFAGAPWTLACYMLDGRGGQGFTRTLEIMRQKPTFFGQLIDRLVEATVLHLSKQIEAGAEVIQLFDSWAGLLREGEAMQWSLAPLLRITGELARLHPRVPVMLFPRQVTRESLAYLAEDGRAAALSLDQDQDRPWAAKVLQPRVALQGNLSPDLLLKGGKELEADTSALLEIFAAGPHIVNLGHGVLQGTPPEHVGALVRQVKRSR